MHKISIAINKPCSQNWNNFGKRGNTGFCASCQKHVVDFTKFTDSELTEYLRTNHGKTCGRLRIDQMKEYTVEENRSAFNKIAAILTAGALVLAQAPDAQAQTKEISGRVLSEDRDIVPGANIIVKNTAQGTVADADGNFRFTYAGSAEEITLIYSFIGHKTQERVVNLAQVSNVGDTILEIEDTQLLMGEIVCTTRKWHGVRGIVYGVKSLFARKY